tara:strand:- start:1070 stop:1477 length:408 start_codon:yes stop_codon:yes gene_type:complete
VKKKETLSKKDQKDWKEFLEKTSHIPNKDEEAEKKIQNKRFKFDLHGFTLDDANKKICEIIKYCSQKNYREILVITGKGLHSSNNNVYESSELSKLRHSVPNFINTNEEITKLVSSISNASHKDGGDGAIVIKLK